MITCQSRVIILSLSKKCFLCSDSIVGSRTLVIFAPLVKMFHPHLMFQLVVHRNVTFFWVKVACWAEQSFIILLCRGVGECLKLSFRDLRYPIWTLSWKRVCKRCSRYILKTFSFCVKNKIQFENKKVIAKILNNYVFMLYNFHQFYNWFHMILIELLIKGNFSYLLFKFHSV